MDEQFLNEQSGVLRARLARIQDQIAFQEAEAHGLAGEFEQPELEERAERDLDLSRIEQLSARHYQEAVEITQALKRIALGTYGTCEVCGQEIGDARLRALPTARLCLEDAEAAGL